MARDWKPAVYPKAKRGQPPPKPPFWVKFRTWERRFAADPWSRKKGFATRAEAQAHGEQKRQEWKLKAAGLWNDQAERAREPLSTYVDKFEQHVLLGLRQRPRRRESPHAKTPRQFVSAFAKWAGVTTVQGLTRDDATRWLTEQRVTKRPTTLNQYRAMLVRFGNWLEDEGVVVKSPFRGLAKIPVDDRQHRQAHTTETVIRLVRAAVQRVLQNARGSTRDDALPYARHRGLIVLTTFLTTMRATALANFAWSWIDEKVGCIRVPAEWVKRPTRPRPQYLPLHTEFAKLLVEVRRERSVAMGRPVQGDGLVVGERDGAGYAYLPGAYNVALRRDAKFVGHEAIDADGCRLDLTSMRTACGTELRRLGVPRSIVSEIMHTTKTTTADRHYIHADEAVIAELRGFLDRIPFKAEAMRGVLFDLPAVPAETGGTAAPSAAPSPLRDSVHQLPSDEPQEVAHAT